MGQTAKRATEAVPKPMSRIGEIDLSKVQLDELKTMRDAGECVRECYRVLKYTNDSIVSEFLKRVDALHADNHNSCAPIIDRKTNSQYRFHTGDAEDRPHETGHFHTFVRPRQIPRVGSPAPADGLPKPPDATGDDLCHIIAIAMDRTGFPTRLFAPNKWVTGGRWHKAADVCQHLTHFTIDHAEPSYPVNVWITNMLVLFRPQIRELLAARDSLIATRRQQRPEQDVLEDRGLAVTVDQTIDVLRQLNAVREALQVRAANTRRAASIINAANATMTAEARPAQSIPPAPRNPAQSIPPAPQKPAQSMEAALETQIQALHDTVQTARTTASALEGEVEKARRQAWEREKQHASELARLGERHENDLVELLKEAKDRLEGEFQMKLAATRTEWQRKTAVRLETVRKETRETVSNARETTVTELRAQWHQERNTVLAEAIETRKQEEAKRLTAAKANWDSARQAALAQRDLTWQVAFDHRVEEALVSWKADEDTRIEEAKAVWNAERRFRAAKRRKYGLWARRTARAVLIAAIIGGVAYYYPKAKPVIAETWDSAVVANWKATTTWITESLYAPDAPAESENSAANEKAASPPEPEIPQSYIRPGAANLRAEPSTAANVIGILRRDTQVQRLGQRGRWVRVSVPGAAGKTGWVHASLLADQPAR